MSLIPCGIIIDCPEPPHALPILPDIASRLDGAILIIVVAVAALILTHALIEHLSRGHHSKPKVVRHYHRRK